MNQSKDKEYLLSIFLYANDEEESLYATIREIVEKLNVNYELIVYMKNESCKSFEALKKIMAAYPQWHVTYRFQVEPYIVATLYEVAKIANGTHILVWTADNEISVNSMVEMAKISTVHPQAIVCASKFHKDSFLNGYSAAKKAIRKFLDYTINILYRRSGTDFYSIYKILPLDYFENMYFSSAHTLLYEYTLVALKLGKEYYDVPVVFQKRTEGQSSFHLLFNLRIGFSFLGSILRVFLTPKRVLRTKRKLTL